MSTNKEEKKETKVVDFGKYAPKKYTYEGVKNVTAFPDFIKLCKATQDELKLDLPMKLVEAGYTDIVTGDGYIYATGNIPILLTAHMDTVHKEPVKDFYEKVDDKGNHIISSPQGIGGDDRCGIYMILEIIKEYKPFVLFCEDEEIGCVGSKKFVATKDLINELCDLKFLIGLDRANKNDAVFYDCDNEDFTTFITETTGYKEAHGSFSDISYLAPGAGVAAVNLSCGYYSAHTLGEKVIVEEMLGTIEAVKKLLTAECEQFEYVEKKYGGYSGYGYGYGYGYGGYGYGDYYDDYGDYEFSGRYYDNSTGKTTGYRNEVVIMVTVKDENDKEKILVSSGYTKENALITFLQDHPDICWRDVVDWDYDWY